MNEFDAKLLAQSFSKILPAVTEGTVAYVTFLDGQTIEDLCSSPAFAINGWTINGVIDTTDSARRLISADQAVELREEKDGCHLLLVDNARARSGMDGIYSACFEVTEKSFFEEAVRLAISETQQDWQFCCRKAVEKARKIGRQNTISPFAEFTFLSKCAADLPNFGNHLIDLGLWPISTQPESPPDEAEIEKSVKLVEKLLLVTGAAQTPSSRVASLLLREADADQVRDLEAFVRGASGRRWTAALIGLKTKPSLWLNKLDPGFFGSSELVSLELIKWRTRIDAKPQAWSGLTMSEADEQMLKIVINPMPVSAKERSKLEVRWKAIPEGLRRDAVQYSVTVISGDDILAEQPNIPHSGKDPQKWKFTEEDFEAKEGDKYVAKIIVRAVGVENVREIETEEFILAFGTEAKDVQSASGQHLRCLVDGTISLEKEHLQTLLSSTDFDKAYTEDRRGYVVFKANQRSFRVFRPSLIREIERDWLENRGRPSRWILRLRPDGTRQSEPQCIAFEDEIPSRLIDACRSFSEFIGRCKSTYGAIYQPTTKNIDEYINSYSAVFESMPGSQLALTGTIEVQSISGRTIGLIVLPWHPVRVAWHYAYDALVQHLAYEEQFSPKRLEKLVSTLNGANYPLVLPGFKPEQNFVFGDMLGFHCVGMVLETETEPRASIALLSKAMSDDTNKVSASISTSISHFLGKEVSRYANLHRNYHNVHVNAFKAGDGCTIARSLGESLSSESSEEVETPVLDREIGFTLRLIGSNREHGTAGSFLTESTEKRRAGIGQISRMDRWMLESYQFEGQQLPRLHWAKQFENEDTMPSHLSVSFDTFDTSVASDNSTGAAIRPLEVYGLVAPVHRTFQMAPKPVWTTFNSTNLDGEKHPAGKVLTDRLLRAQNALLQTTGQAISPKLPEQTAILRTTLNQNEEQTLSKIHELSDWVVTIDRHGGLEYFDSPREATNTYESFVIDCVPERPSLGTMQLVTSTSHLSEVTALLSRPLIEMQLSCSARNCEFLLMQLKGLSGRLAMRLANSTQHPGELISLSLLYANCLQEKYPGWCDLNEGFYVPLDDVPELCPNKQGLLNGSSHVKADLIYVTASKRGSLSLCFVEVKYRRHLRSARTEDLLESIHGQLKNTRSYWMDSFLTESLSPTEASIKRSMVGRILRFYADKARRHYLQDDVYTRITKEIDKFMSQTNKYQINLLTDKGFVFCPEFTATQPERIPFTDQIDVYLFGPSNMPDNRSTVFGTTNHASRPAKQELEPEPELVSSSISSKPITEMSLDTPVSESISQASQGAIALAEPVSIIQTNNNEIVLGTSTASGENVVWRPSVTGNPHMMIVGLPGMGKTTTLLATTQQLLESGISPIVFSYHQDFDEKISEAVGPDNIHFVDYNGLGFNPLRIVSPSPLAYLDNAGMLRDIFSAVFSELGDLQTEKIRESIKQSYLELGWGESPESLITLDTPKFNRFYELLEHQDKVNAGLMARLAELNDYGFFAGTGESRSVLNQNGISIIRLHRTSNECLQKAFASFVLYNIYQEMFIRGVQPGICNSVIFDEAHKASKLTLIGRMGKECRKYGISLIVASQEVKDFSPSLFAAVSNYLLLRLTDTDARVAAKNVAPADTVIRVTDRLKSMPKHHAMFFSEGSARPEIISLLKK